MPYNKNNTLILVLLLIGLIGLLTLANGQASQAWARRWTSAGSNADYAYVMTTDNTGNVYVAGSMQTSSSNSRAQVIKYNTNGDTLWRWTDPYTGTFNERASSIVVGPSGNVYIAGYTMRVGSGDYLIVKLNGQTGDTIWFRTYDLPGATTGYDFARRIAIDADENVYVTGYGSRPGTGTSDIGTIKYNTAGVFQWEAFYDGGVAGADQGYSIYVNETGVYVTGYSNPSASGTAYDMVTIKYNPTNGNEVWSRRYNGTGNGADYGRDVVADASGNVYVTGSATNANTDFTTIKYNSSGDTFWLRTYNGPDNLGDAGWWIKLDGSGNVYVYGNSTYSATDRGQDLCVVKYDNNGNQQMVATYNGPNVYEICPDETGQNPIALDANGNIYIAGTSRRAAPSTLNDIIAVKFNSSGTFQWEARYDYNDNSETAKSIGLDNSNNVYVSGHGNGLGTNIDWVTVKYTQGVTGTDYTSQASGNWSNPNTWTPPGGPPTIYDNVTIATGHTVTVDGSAGCKNLTIQTGATFDNSGNYAFAINGDLINDGTFTAGTGVYTFGGSADSISGTNPVVIPNLSMVGSYTNNTTLTVSTTLSGAGSLIQGTNATLNIGAPTVGPSLNASATGNTVRYNSTTQDQTIKGITYHNLVIDKGSYTATLDANATVARNLIIASGILNDNAKVLTVNGDITNNGSHIGSGNGRIRLAGGSGEHILSGAGSYNNLVMNDVNGASLTASFTVNGVLYCSTGVITTNANVITLSNTAVGAISGGSSSSYINGPLARTLPADLATGTTYRFPIGKSAYQLFELVNPTTGSSGPIIITAEVFDANCGGTPGTGLVAINTDRYWSAQISGTGNLISTKVRLTETNITPRNVIGQSATQTGAYNNIGGTRTATTVLSQTITSLGYFVIGTSGYLNAGTYTVGTGQNYENLTAVSDELRAKTLAGNVVFELTANYSSATETYPIVFDSFAIEGGYWTVTIKPASGVQTLIEGSNSTAIFNLNGVQRLIIDGSASSRTNDLTISNTNTSGCAIRFINGACYNTVKNCIVKAVNDAGELGGAIFFATSATGIGNNYNTIDNCDITCGTLPLRYGIRMSGSSSPAQNNGNVIKNCRFVDFKVYGVGITANTINTTITECEFYNTVPQDGSQHDGIYISAANIANTNITRNKFYDFMSASTLTSDRMRAINLSAGTTNGVITIANNFISLGDRANNPNVGIFAIRDGSGTNSRSDIYYNSIYIGGTGITSTAQSSAGYSREYATNTNFKNNIVFNNRTNVGLGPGKHYCIFASSTGGTFNSDYNDLYCADDDSSYIGYWTSAQKTLEDWQNATSQDANSISRNPEFLSTTNLHINPYSSNVNRRGTPIAGISLDIDGETRNDTFPDIGADEYTPIPTYTITANAYGGGSIIPSGEIVIFQGEDTTFIITPNSNHHLDSLLVDGVNHGSDSAYYRFENVNANHTIDAYFSINTYTITATATSGGTITPSGNVIVAYGEDTTFYITPDPNYQIDDVLVDALSIGPVTQYTFEDVTTNHTIHAIFSLTTPPPSPGWTELESMPTGVALKYVKNGGALTSATEPGEKVMSLYAFRGNKSNEFKKYYQGAWTDVETIGYALKYPVTDSSRYNKKKPDKGAALCFDGNHTIYATKGAGTFELWRYDLDSAHWYFENWLPSTKGAKGGTSLFYKGGLLYVLVGGQKLTAENFFAYDPINKLWATLQKAPAGTTNKMWKDGSAIVAIGETIFGLKGSDKYNSFWVYDITTNNWSEIESCPKNHPSLNKKNTVKDGGAMCTDGSVIYMIKGNGKQDFWKYTPTTNAWTPLDTIRRLHKKSVPKTGAGLAYANGRVYLLKGNNTPEFWQYGITEMSNVKVQMSNLSTATENSELRVQNSKLIEINPNPITQFTTIRYTVPISGKVSIRIYNAEGRLVKNLLDEYKNVGYYLISMSAKHFTSGVYFLRYNNNDYQQEIKLIIQ